MTLLWMGKIRSPLGQQIWRLLYLEGVLKKHLPKTLNPFRSLGHWNDARAALISLLELIDLNDPTSFCNPWWCVDGFSDIGNKGFDYVS